MRNDDQDGEVWPENFENISRKAKYIHDLTLYLKTEGILRKFQKVI
jgi:hypothetical protein